MQAFRYHSIVKENGTIEMPRLPLNKGQRIEIIIFPEGEDFTALMAASESALKFWDNPADEVWNDE